MQKPNMQMTYARFPVESFVTITIPLEILKMLIPFFTTWIQIYYRSSQEIQSNPKHNIETFAPPNDHYRSYREPPTRRCHRSPTEAGSPLSYRSWLIRLQRIYNF
jgi:hypothetical protein